MMKVIGLCVMYTTHLGGRTSACLGVAFVLAISWLLFLLQRCDVSEGGPPCSSMSSGEVWAYYSVLNVVLDAALVNNSNSVVCVRWLPSNLKGVCVVCVPQRPRCNMPYAL